MEAFNPTKVNFKTFKNDLTKAQLAHALGLGAAGGALQNWNPWVFETLSIPKMVGKGRTNLTLIRPDVVQADAATPYAGFDRTTGVRNPVAQFHFRADAYGFNQTRRYIAKFYIECFDDCSFELNGFAGAATLSSGVRTVGPGRRVITVAINNLAPTQEMYANIRQITGTAWNFYQLTLGIPLLLAFR